VCHRSCIIFGARSLTSDEVKGKDILEVGSRDVNGSLRSIITAWRPKRYVGVDAEKGPGVDVVCSASAIVDRFGEESFDIVISTEMLEHVKDWRKAISSIKQVCKPEGSIVLTTRSEGFGYHGYPFDFWRFGTEDMQKIFADFNIVSLEKDREAPGVFLKACKPENFVETDLTGYGLYSIIRKARVVDITETYQSTLAFSAITVNEKMKCVAFKIARRLMKRMYPEQYFG
jgi:SAM-dependent methyltransferase